MSAIYEKPMMKKVALRSNRNIADTCWGYAANGAGDDSKRYYYELSNKDYGGLGTWVSFHVAGGGNCNSVKDAEMRIIDYGPGIKEEKKADARDEFNAAFESTFSPDTTGNKNWGSPFQGTSFATTPGDSW